MNARFQFTCLLLTLLYLAGMPATAQVYKYVDENGNTVYSDTPPAEQEDLPPARLPDLIIQPAIKIPDNPQETTADTDATEISVSIVSPANETTITPGQSSFTVAAETSRPMVQTEVAILLVNGEEFDRSNTGLSWTIDNLIRGEMRLQVQIRNQDDELLAESDLLRVFVHRPSILR